MGRHRNLKTGVVVVVDDSKDDRFASGYEPVDVKPAPKKADKKSES